VAFVLSNVLAFLVSSGKLAIRACCGHYDPGSAKGLICDSLCLGQILGVIDG